jgi:hypothetical protein
MTDAPDAPTDRPKAPRECPHCDALGAVIVEKVITKEHGEAFRASCQMCGWEWTIRP